LALQRRDRVGPLAAEVLLEAAQVVREEDDARAEAVQRLQARIGARGGAELEALDVLDEVERGYRAHRAGADLEVALQIGQAIFATQRRVRLALDHRHLQPLGEAVREALAPARAHLVQEALPQLPPRA